jgi:hypothetical protein
MSATIEDVLQPFQAAASAAHIAETEFSKEFDRELARRRRAREFAYRRLGLLKELAKAAQAGTAESVAVALRGELGWHETSAIKDRVLDAFKPVAEAVCSRFQAKDGEECKSIEQAFAAFEAWYLKDTGQPFLALLDHEIPEMPLVDL